MTIKVEMKQLDSHLFIPVISPAVCSKKTLSPFSYFEGKREVAFCCLCEKQPWCVFSTKQLYLSCFLPVPDVLSKSKIPGRYRERCSEGTWLPNIISCSVVSA